MLHIPFSCSIPLRLNYPFSAIQIFPREVTLASTLFPTCSRNTFDCETYSLVSCFIYLIIISKSLSVFSCYGLHYRQSSSILNTLSSFEDKNIPCIFFAAHLYPLLGIADSSSCGGTKKLLTFTRIFTDSAFYGKEAVLFFATCRVSKGSLKLDRATCSEIKNGSDTKEVFID